MADARVQVQAGPSDLRTSDFGHAAIGWNRDEWDVNCTDGAVYRIYRDRERDRWFVDGVVD